jgi:hypothetical protein
MGYQDIPKTDVTKVSATCGTNAKLSLRDSEGIVQEGAELKYPMLDLPELGGSSSYWAQDTQRGLEGV